MRHKLILFGNSWDPRQLGGLQAWYKADAITGVADGGGVASFPDSSGNGWSLGPGSNPTYRAAPSGILLPAVEFNGTSNFLKNTSFTLAQPFTIFWVGKMLALPGATTGPILSASNVAAAGLQCNTAGGDLGMGFGTNVTSAQAFNTTGFHIIIATAAASSGNAWYDGSKAMNAVNPSGNGFVSIGLGATAGGSNFRNYQFAEGGVINRVLNTGEINQLITYANTRTGLNTATI